MIEILNDNHYATFYMPCNADDLDENKPQIGFLSLFYQGKIASSLRKQALVLNQRGVPFKPTSTLVVQHSAYINLFYTISVCVFAYYCICLCSLFFGSQLLAQPFFNIILKIAHHGTNIHNSYLGKVRIKLLPLPTSDFTLILPSCRVIICLHKLNPMPEPDVLVVKKGTNILSSTSGRMPSPLSDIVNAVFPVESFFTFT